MANPKEKTPKWSDVKAKIGNLPSSKLVAMIGDLYRLSQENREFLHARFGIGGDPIAPYKEIISASLYPDVMDREPLSIETAERAITQYGKASGDEKGVLDLMVHFGETGISFASTTSLLACMSSTYIASMKKANRKSRESR